MVDRERRPSHCRRRAKAVGARAPYGWILTLSLAAQCAACGPSAITVDVSRTGATLEHVAVGFYGQPTSGTWPPSESYDAIHPIASRLDLYGARSDPELIAATYARMKDLGETVQVILSGTGHGFIFGAVSNYSIPYPFEDTAAWNEFVTWAVTMAKDHGWSIEWDLWNEPTNHCNWSTEDINCYWPERATEAQYLETWKNTYRLVRSVDPKATIVGPSTSWFDPVFMERFLAHCKANDVVPDVLSWHEFGATDSDIARIADHAATARAQVAALGLSIARFSIGEYGPLSCHGGNDCIQDRAEFNRADLSVAYFYALEKAGVDNAMRSTIGEFNGWRTRDTVNNLVTPDQKPRSNFHAYKFYSEMTGARVDLDSMLGSVDGVSAIASADAGGGSVALLLGRTDNERVLNLTLRGLASVFGPAAEATLSVTRVARSERGEAVVTSLANEPRDIGGGTLQFSFAEGDVGDIYLVRLSR